MNQSSDRGAVAIVGVGAVLPGAPNVPTLWDNLRTATCSIVETPADRWDPAKYYHPDPKAVDKTYSKIGGWIREFTWDPFSWKMPIPPRVAESMDLHQKWSLAATREALVDYGYPERPLDRERTAVIVGNAMGGDKQLYSSLRIFAPEYLAELNQSETFASLQPAHQERIREDVLRGIRDRLPSITEDTMPGELANIVAGRIAAIFDLHGPNYVTDAACASAMAAMSAAIEGLSEHHYDAVVTGGVDANMSPSTFVKFCKIGALSATGSRPYDADADGFVMGEGCTIFLMKRLDDAERDGDRIYAVVRGIGGASDGKGKGITAPNPIGQQLAVKRAWALAGERPDLDTLMEGHGTSTRVGDVVEVNALAEALSEFGLPLQSIPLGSIKSNIGHLKGAAGGAGILKATLAIHHRAIPPSLSLKTPNPKIGFDKLPFFVNTEHRPWETRADGIRRAGVSAFGFGGTNFHAVLEEYVPGRLRSGDRTQVAVSASPRSQAKAPLRGLAVMSGNDLAEVRAKLSAQLKQAAAGQAPAPSAPSEADFSAKYRLAVDFGDAAELATRLGLADKALASGNPMAFAPLRARGVHVGQGPRPKVAFLYTGQGSQYVNMIRALKDREPVVAETVAEADKVMTPILGKPLSSYLYADPSDEAAMAKANEELRQTAITQPAVLTVDIAMTRLLALYGIEPDMVMGHSLGEYGALVAAGGMDFAHALEAVAARGQEMTKVSMADNGKMAAVMGPIDEVQAIVDGIDGYVVIANINSHRQAVIGGASDAVERAVQVCLDKGMRAQLIPVSHAFHTSIVAPASEPLKEVLGRLDLRSVKVPLVGNVHGDFYPTGSEVQGKMIDLLGQQIASPVQFVTGLETLYQAGARVFVEVGPKKALHGFVEDVLGQKEGSLALFTNHPKLTDEAAFNQALAGLYARGAGTPKAAEVAPAKPVASKSVAAAPSAATNGQGNGHENGHRKTAFTLGSWSAPSVPAPAVSASGGNDLAAVGRLFARFMEDAFQVMGSGGGGLDRTPIVISGASVGLPGGDTIFQDDNVARLLRGEQFIDAIPMSIRREMVERNITRVVKSADGSGSFEVIETPSDGIKLAGQPGALRLVEDFGYPEDRVSSLDITTAMAIAAGIEALRDAGIPLVHHYKTTTRGTFLPDRWMLPEALRDETGVVFGSAFPGMDNFAQEAEAFRKHKELEARRGELISLRDRFGGDFSPAARSELERRISSLESEIEEHAYRLDRRFIFRVLAMGHSQFAEFIGARGPNTQVNAACASGTQALGIAEDWIRTGRCRRVIVLSCDNVTSESLLPWVGSGFVATGAAATDELIEEAALPFDRRRHGLILGMGASAAVVERADAVAERGMYPIAELLGSKFQNSAFHGTRLDPPHISGQMEALVADVEQKYGLNRADMARQMVFVSHETYTPARGGSAQTEVRALRTVFGEHADEIVVANTKGMTGHAMGTGIEDVLGIKALETGEIPAVPNFKEVDPELGTLNLSRGGTYPVEYALRLGAGFGSQLAFTLIRRVPNPSGTRPTAHTLGYATRITDAAQWNKWLAETSGHKGATVEVVNRTLRVVDQGPSDASVRGALESKPAPVVSGVPSAAVLPSTPAPSAARAGLASAPVLAPAPAPAPAEDAVEAQIMALVAEQTGYPTDMLDPELDLEADLGIDTVKQAEMFSAVREAFHIERDPNLQLREFNTLTKVVGFVKDRRPDLAVAPVAATAAPPSGADAVEAQIMALVAEQTGYPTDMLDPELDLEADLGIDTVKQAEMFSAVREAFHIERDPNLQLREFNTLTKVVGFVKDRRPDLASAPSSAILPAPAGGDAVEAQIMALVAAQTGYPTDMLDPELDLEADLGIDTVKQAEMFAAVRESFGIERDPNLQLREFNTLTKVVGFVKDRRPDLASGPAVAAATGGAVAPGAATGAAASGGEDILARIYEIVTQQTGYPSDMLDPELDLEADLGIDTVKQAEMFAAVRESFGIERDPNLQLREFNTLSKVVGFVETRRPAPAASAPAEGAAPSGDDGILARIYEIVTQQTGYPSDMLDPELDLEADLGIDTVKQAEMFAAVRESFEIERDPNLQLREFNTLNKVVGFVRDRRPQGPGKSAGWFASADEEAPAAAQAFQGSLDAAAAIPRRVCTSLLRPAIGLTKETGVQWTPGRRVVVMPDQGGVAEALTESLRSKGVEVVWLDPSQASADAERLAQLDADGVFWLPALDYEGDFTTLSKEAFQAAVDLRVKRLHRVMQTLYGAIDRAGRFLMSATRLGGRFGYEAAGATAPLGGAVCGFTKTYARERPDALVKVVDFASQESPENVASALLEEAERDPGAVEVGRDGAERTTVGLVEKPVEDGAPGMSLSNDTVWVVTGAAGSITSAIVADLATASAGGTFHLLDLAPEPSEDDADLQTFMKDPEALKGILADRMRAEGDKPTPVKVKKILDGLERKAAALSALRSVQGPGGTAHYHSVDLRDDDAVRGVVSKILEAHGRIDVLLHAAGLEISRTLPDKSAAEFDLVFDVKAQGWQSLLAACGDLRPAATVAFSSIAGRFGNGGQTDYAAANDFLAKTSTALRAQGVRAMVMDWTAWGGIGMATRGSIPKLMAAAGIGMLPPEAGIAFIRRELISGGRADEVVVAQGLGILEGERDVDGGLDRAAIEALAGPMVGEVKGAFMKDGWVVETSLDPKQQPFLFDHRIEGTPVLPGVMGLEGFAEIASWASSAGLGQQLHLVGLEDVAFAMPFKFYRDEARTLRLETQLERFEDEVLARCRLVGRRRIAGQEALQETLHFQGTVRLSASAPEIAPQEIPSPSGEAVDESAIYKVYFHGPAYQVLDRVFRADAVAVGELSAGLPPNHSPEGARLTLEPRWVEACFQTAGVKSIGETGVMALPAGIERLLWVKHDGLEPQGRLRAIVRPRDVSTVVDADLVDESGRVLLRLEGYRTVEHPERLDDQLSSPFRLAFG